MYDSRTAIANGQQVGFSSRIMRGAQQYWTTVAIQKFNNEYIVHLDLILDSKMASEEYELYATYAFSSIETALMFVVEKSPVSIADLAELQPFKGQKGFDPRVEEFIRIPDQR
jgi:hypothetical protein